MLLNPCTVNSSLELVSLIALLHYTHTYLRIPADLTALAVTSPKIQRDHVKQPVSLHSMPMILPIDACLCAQIALITMVINKNVEGLVQLQHLLITLQDFV